VGIPEIGPLQSRTARCLVEFAPYDDDSCARHGRHQIASGRERVTVEFAAAPFVANPQSIAMPQRLMAAGKEHKIGGWRQKA
jgi:hypothetical protein